MEYLFLREQATGKLVDVNAVVEALLARQDLLPTELRIKLDTFHSDITAILEDREDEAGPQGKSS